jgi:20S proteasome alpha/beta subunit
VLYHTDPSGTFVRFKAKAIGSGSEGAQTNLQEALADGTDVSRPCCVLALRVHLARPARARR